MKWFSMLKTGQDVGNWRQNVSKLIRNDLWLLLGGHSEIERGYATNVYGTTHTTIIWLFQLIELGK